MDTDSLSRKVIGCAFRIHNHFGFGFLEKVYENALAIELIEVEGIAVQQQFPIPVFYRDQKVGEYFADLFVEKLIIVELKSAAQIRMDQEAQLVHYLHATSIDHGLLINFGPSVVVRHKYRKYKIRS